MEEIGEKTKALPNMFASGVEGGFSNQRCLQQTRPSGWVVVQREDEANWWRPPSPDQGWSHRRKKGNGQNYGSEVI